MKRICTLLLFTLFCNYIFADLVTNEKARLLQLAKTICGDRDYNYYYSQGYIGYMFSQGRPEKSRLIFVDLEPTCGWEHNCKYIYVSATFSNYEVVDSLLPPADITLSPLEINNPGSSALQQFTLPTLQSNGSDAAGRTYAVIINGGLNKNANNERYWNDCAFIYQTLHNIYEVPRTHIKVVYADGTNPEPDLVPNGTEELIDSPLDFDGDGIDDIQYSATKENLQTVFQDLGNTMTDEDHLFVFVTGHGHKSPIGNSIPSLYLWNNVQLSPDEFSDYLDLVDVQCINVVMGQCYSGAFIDAVHGDNRIIATACTEDQKSYGFDDLAFDMFLYHWTSAIAQMDHNGNPVSSDMDHNGYISMQEAFSYAKEQGLPYTEGNWLWNETPQIDYIAGVLYDDLSFDMMPKAVDLYIRDNPFDTGKETSFHEPHYYGWNSPDLYLRMQDDGETNNEHEMLYVEDLSSGQASFFVYVLVHNRGTKTFYQTDENMYVHLFATNSNGRFHYNKFIGQHLFNNEIGQYIGRPRINRDIAPGDSALIEVPSKLYADFDAHNNTNHYFPLSLLGIISKENNLGTMYTTIGIDSLVNIRKISNDIAMRNEASIYVFPNGYAEIMSAEMSLLSIDSCSLRILASNESLKNALSVRLPMGTTNYGIQYDSREEGPLLTEHLNHSLVPLSNVAELNRLDFSNLQQAKIQLVMNRNSIMVPGNFSEGDSLTILQYDTRNGNILAGMTYVVKMLEGNNHNGIENSPHISDIRFISENMLEVNLSECISGADISVSNCTDVVNSTSQNIDEASSVTIDLPEDYNGILYLNLRKNGQLLDSKKILK